MDKDAVAGPLTLNAQWVDDVRRAWLALMGVAMRGEIRGFQPGGGGPVREHVAEALAVLARDARNLQGMNVAHLKQTLSQLDVVLAQRLPDLKARSAALLKSP